MDRSTFHFHMETTFATCLALSKRKNADYAGADDPFANFRQVEHLGLCSVETGILVRLSDKMTRVANLLANGGRDAQVADESVLDTIHDSINYLAILAAWLKEKKTTPRGIAFKQKWECAQCHWRGFFDELINPGEGITAVPSRCPKCQGVVFTRFEDK